MAKYSKVTNKAAALIVFLILIMQITPINVYARGQERDAKCLTSERSLAKAAAVITKNFYVIYHTNGGHGGPADYHIYRRGSIMTIRFNPAPIRQGYIFLGWARTSNAKSAEFPVGATAPYIMGAYNLNLYAVWQAIPYTVTYHANGGSGTIPIDNNYYHYGQPVIISERADITMPGYTFIGWAEKSDAVVPQYSPGRKINMKTSNITLYAVWMAVPIEPPK